MVSEEELREKIYRIYDSIPVEGGTITPAARKRLFNELERLVIKESQKAALRMADNLIAQEVNLYKVYNDDDKVCVGIKIMADEVREYYTDGTYGT